MIVLLSAFVALALAATPANAQTGSQQAKIFSDCTDTCPSMIVIPAGTATIGSGAAEQQASGLSAALAVAEGPAHPVAFAHRFAVSRTEITVGQWSAFVKDGRRADPVSCVTHDAASDRWVRKAGTSWRQPGFEQSPDSPAICISWNEARAYVDWLSRRTGRHYRLLSEAEWEYAARGGTATSRYWGDDVGDACERANIMSSATFDALGAPPSWKNKLICQGAHAWTMTVGQFAPNPFGLYDMYGNALEWIEDCYHAGYDGAPIDGTAREDANCQRRSMRGGAFDAKPTAARSAARGFPLAADFRAIVSGFRVARDLD